MARFSTVRTPAEALPSLEDSTLPHSGNSSPPATDYTGGYDSAYTSASMPNEDAHQPRNDMKFSKASSKTHGSASSSVVAETPQSDIKPRGRPAGARNKPKVPITSPRVSTRKGTKRQRSKSPSSLGFPLQFEPNTSVTVRLASPVKKQRNEAPVVARKQTPQAIFVKGNAVDQTERLVTAGQPSAERILNNLGSDLQSFLLHLKGDSAVSRLNIDFISLVAHLLIEAHATDEHYAQWLDGLKDALESSGTHKDSLLAKFALAFWDITKRIKDGGDGVHPLLDKWLGIVRILNPPKK